MHIISDGFESMTAVLSLQCLKDLTETYPSTFSTLALDNYMAGVKEFEIQVRQSYDKTTCDALGPIQLICFIKKMTIITFDRVQAAKVEHIETDIGVRNAMSYFRHHYLKVMAEE